MIRELELNKKHSSANVMYLLGITFLTTVLSIYCLIIAFNTLDTQCTITGYQPIESYEWVEPISSDFWIKRSIHNLPINITYYRYGKKWKGLQALMGPKSELERDVREIPIGTMWDCYKMEGEPYFYLGHNSVIYHVLGWIGVLGCIIGVIGTILWARDCGSAIKQMNQIENIEYTELPGNYA